MKILRILLFPALLTALIAFTAFAASAAPLYEYDRDHDGIWDDIDPAPYNNRFTLTLQDVSGGSTPAGDTMTIPCRIDYSLLTEGDNTRYSEDVAVLALIWATEAYGKSSVTVAEGAPFSPAVCETPAELAELFGLSDFRQIAVASPDGHDADDVTEILLAHRNVDGTELVLLAVRGTQGETEWLSNLDPGADTADYRNTTGTLHPDWSDPANHKGFDVAATRVIRELEQYAAECLPDAPRVLLVTGHSRGGAIANLIGARIERGKDCAGWRSFAYTFSSPRTTAAYDVGKIYTVFNIVNSDDIVTMVPMESIGFKRYGRDVAASADENAELWASLTGRVYHGGDVSAMLATLNTFAAGRADCYEKDCTFTVAVAASSAEDAIRAVQAHYEAEGSGGYVTATAARANVMGLFTRRSWTVTCRYAPIYAARLLLTRVMTGNVADVFRLEDNTLGSYANLLIDIGNDEDASELVAVLLGVRGLDIGSIPSLVRTIDGTGVAQAHQLQSDYTVILAAGRERTEAK